MSTYPRISQIRKDYDLVDNKSAGATLETEALTARQLFESIASQLVRIIDVTGTGNWYDDIPEVNSKKRSLLQLNQAVDALETASSGNHEDLDTLTHAIVESNYTEYTYSGDTLTSVVVWKTPAKLTKIREITLTYTGDLVGTTTAIQYDAAGTPIATLAKTFTYDGSNNVTAITGTRS